MFLDLSHFLNLTSSKLNENYVGQNILIIENSKSNQANFIISHQLLTSLKTGQVCLIAFSQTFTHYASVGKKLAIDLSNYVQNDQLVFVNGLELIQNLYANDSKIGDLDGKSLIMNLFLKISVVMERFKSNQQKICIIDDVSILLSLGCGLLDIFMLFNHLIKLHNSDGRFGFTSLIHIFDDFDDELVKLERMLIRQHDVIITVSPLKTGYCRDITGQICVEWMKDNEGEFAVACHSEKKAHYKLTDRTCSIFPIGLSTALV